MRPVLLPVLSSVAVAVLVAPQLACSSLSNTGPCSAAQLTQHETECIARGLDVIHAGMCDHVEDVEDCEAMRPVLENCEAMRAEWQQCR